MKRGGGKTPLVIGGDWEKGMAKLWQEKGMSTLIVDTFPHPKYAHVEIIKPSQYGLLSSKPGIYRTLSSVNNMPFLMEELTKVYNTLIVFEDCYKYIGEKFSDPEVALIGDTKQKNVDLLYMHWCWGWASPDLLRITNYYVIGPTSDSPEVRKPYLKGCYDVVMDAHKKVSTGKHPYLVVDSGI